MLIIKSLLYFLLAGLCEIGGGYLMWLWIREGRSLLFGLSGAAILIVYGIVPTLQPEGNFGRVYAAYGGIFIALSILWGWLIDNVQPDRFDIIGGSSRSPAWPSSCMRRTDGFADEHSIHTEQLFNRKPSYSAAQNKRISPS